MSTSQYGMYFHGVHFYVDAIEYTSNFTPFWAMFI
jgi:hypothetical protein